MCHDGPGNEFKASVHGKAVAAGVPEAPVCTDCHGFHGIQPKTSAISPVNPLRIRDTCEACHGNVRLTRTFGLPADRVLSFDASFHGLAAKSGSQTVANCASCHGFHSILPSSDPKASTNPKNLDQTCGKCHQGAGERFALGPIHVVDGGKGEHPAVGWVRETYLILIPLTIGLMMLHNGGDLVRKLWNLRIRPSNYWTAAATAPLAGTLRMLPFERFQHALLAVSFIILAWTGFALKYPDHWWARPLMFWDGAARAYIHRIAAIVMTAVSVIHLISLIANKKLREHWRHMLPRVADAREGVSGMAFNLGLRAKRPHRSSHSYIEKAEYWAVVWGAVVMAGTGFALWANTFMLRFFPKWLLDVATAVHFYEAVLATLAIIVWHFYFVIFDPEVYPMDTAWLTGRSPRRQSDSHGEHAAGD
jgi:cytochrome b subunit of formate dehydrogenase